jgi:hypothetical protein
MHNQVIGAIAHPRLHLTESLMQGTVHNLACLTQSATRVLLNRGAITTNVSVVHLAPNTPLAPHSSSQHLYIHLDASRTT